MKAEKKFSRVVNKIFPADRELKGRQNRGVSKEFIVDLLVNGIANLERGLLVLDRNLIITRRPLDVLAVSQLGKLVLIELDVEEDERIILRALEHFDWLLNNIDAIVNKYNTEKIDITLAPRIILVSRKFSGGFLRKLSYVSTTEIDLYEYTLDEVDGITKFNFKQRKFSLAKDRLIQINKPGLQELVERIRIVSLRKACHRIIKEAKNSHRELNVDTSLGYIEVKGKNSSLLSIYPQPTFFWVSVGSKGRWHGIKVENEGQIAAILRQLK